MFDDCLLMFALLFAVFVRLCVYCLLFVCV